LQKFGNLNADLNFQQKESVMKTLVIANQKGGVGKTAILVHLAFNFQERGKKVIVIDLDTQGNASYTLQRFATDTVASHLFNHIPPIIKNDKRRELALIKADAALANLDAKPLKEVSQHFHANVSNLAEQNFDICLIDTAPSLGIGMVTALTIADYVLSPIELELYSIHGIKKMNTTIANIRKVNPKLQFLGMVPSKVDKRNPRHNHHLQQLQTTYPQLILPTSVGLRSSIADALASGMPVWKIKKTAARIATKEILNLADLIFNKMATVK